MSSYRALGLGLELGTGIAGLAIVGYFADQYFGTQPWLALSGALLGLVGGMYSVITQVQRSDTRRQANRPGAPGSKTHENDG